MWENGNRKAAILTTVVLALILIFCTALPQWVGAQTDGDTPAGSATAQLTAYKRAISYPEYLAQHREITRPDREIVIPAEALSILMPKLNCSKIMKACPASPS